jgi:hypothetical protein
LGADSSAVHVADCSRTVVVEAAAVVVVVVVGIVGIAGTQCCWDAVENMAKDHQRIVAAVACTSVSFLGTELAGAPPLCTSVRQATQLAHTQVVVVVVGVAVVAAVVALAVADSGTAGEIARAYYATWLRSADTRRID